MWNQDCALLSLFVIFCNVVFRLLSNVLFKLPIFIEPYKVENNEIYEFIEIAWVI